MKIFHWKNKQMKKNVFFILMFAFSGFSLRAWGQAKEPLFTLLNEKSTGVKFVNAVREDDSLHVFKYEYLYNGHGIGVGDFDGDGWMDLFISGNAVPNKLFLNTKGFTFKDVTK